MKNLHKLKKIAKRKFELKKLFDSEDYGQIHYIKTEENKNTPLEV